MRVLHLNTHSSGGSYEYATLLSTSSAAHGIESRVLCKNSPSPQTGRVLLDRVIRRAYVSFSTEPWHGTRRLLCPPGSEELKGVDVVHLHTVADWFDVPHWLDTLPAHIGIVISLHDMWHFSGGCFLYRGCDRYRASCSPCPILKSPFNRVLARDELRRKLQAYRNCRAQFVANCLWLAELAGRSPIVKASGGARVIPPGIDTTVFKPQDKNLCRNNLDLPADAFVIVTGGATVAVARSRRPHRFGIRRRRRAGSAGFESSVYRRHSRSARFGATLCSCGCFCQRFVDGDLRTHTGGSDGLRNSSRGVSSRRHS